MTRIFLAFAGLLPALCGAHTFTVTNTRDDENEGSFRWAVNMCNWYPILADTVVFAIPMTDPGYNPSLGVWTIQADTLDYDAYMFNNDGTVVDGFSQAVFIGHDTNPLGPEIELRGPGYNRTGFHIQGDRIEIRGLCMNRFEGTPISISGWPEGEIADSVVVVGCYLNVDPTGSWVESWSHGALYLAEAAACRIGGDSPEERNIISGGNNSGLCVSQASGIEIINNYIGVDRTGTVVLARSLTPFSISAMRGPILVRNNLIGGSSDSTVALTVVMISAAETDSGRVSFVYNQVGIGTDGGAIGGSICIEFGSRPDSPQFGHYLAYNTIAYAHGWNGVYVTRHVDYVTISRNSIFGCNRLGIDLSNTACTGAGVDLIDGVYGPGANEEIDPCYCDSVVQGPRETAVYMTCMKDCTVEVFIGESGGYYAWCPLSGYGHVYSGVTYLGDAEEIMPGPVFSQYRLAVSPPLPPGTTVVSTATNQNGSTSEFGCSCQLPLAGESARGCLPSEFRFFPPSPNPCTEGVAIRFHLPEVCVVRVTVYDVGGREVGQVANGRFDSGVHGLWWSAEDSHGQSLPSGSYVVRMETDKCVSSQQVAVVR